MNFQLAADLYLHDIQTASNPARPKTISSYRSIIRKHLAPRYSSMELSDIATQNNRLLRELVRDLRTKYRPASITLIVSLAKQIIDHPKDSNGVPLYRCVWNNSFIDLPAINTLEQRAPMISTEEVNAIVVGRKDSLLYATLCGTGLRIGELLALTSDDWNQQAGIFYIRASKTAAGIREVDVPMVLNDQLRASIGSRQGRLFPEHLTSLRRRAKDVIGFAHSFRRFRLTHLRMSGMPEDLIALYMGHAAKTVTDRYSRIRLNKEFRREWTERSGLGFTLQPHLYNDDNNFPANTQNCSALQARDFLSARYTKQNE